MNEALISGLLGAVMGGASSMEKSIGEEMAAKQKEEEEKRREERALTIAERKKDMEIAKQKALDAEERARVSKMMGPETRMTPGANPMEPEGVVESQIPLEERLKIGMQKAASEGDIKTQKGFLEQYQALMEIERKTAEEARKQEEFGKEKPERITGKPAEIKFIAESTYKGPVGEDGKPEPKAFAEHLSNVATEYKRKETYIRPEREPGAIGGQRPPTAGQLMAAEYKIGAKLKENFTEGTGDKKKVNQDLVNRAELVAIELIDKSDPSKRIDILKIQNDAVAQVRAAKKKAEEQVGAQFDAMKDKGGVTRSRYIERNYMDYIDDYLGKAQEPAAPSAGAPWTRSWRQ